MVNHTHAVTNLVSEPGANAHWLAVARQPGERDLLFDTFARPPSATRLPHMRHMETTDPDVNQEKHSLPERLVHDLGAQVAAGDGRLARDAPELRRRRRRRRIVLR